MPPSPDRGPAAALRRRLDRLPPGRRRAVALGLLAGYFSAGYLLVVGLTSLIGDGPVDWTGPLGPLIGSLLGTALVLWWGRRRIPRGNSFTEYPRALRTGRLPDGVDPASWRPLLEGERRAYGRARVVVVGTTVILAAVVLVLAVLRGLDPWLWAVVVGMALMVVVPVWSGGGRQLRAVERLLEQAPSEPAP